MTLGQEFWAYAAMIGQDARPHRAMAQELLRDQHGRDRDRHRASTARPATPTW